MDGSKQESMMKMNRWNCYRMKKPRIAALEQDIKVDCPAKAVMFVQNTKDSILANKIRDMVQYSA